MKLFIAAFLVGLLPLAVARNINVIYPKGTPKLVIGNGKQSIIDAGGKVTHDYPALGGFSADAPEDAIQGLDDLSPKYQPTIEGDQPVSIN